MRNIGFTGSRTLRKNAEPAVERILYSLNGDKVITGACIGLDEFVARWFAENRPHVQQTIFVPGNRSRVSVPFINDMHELPNVEMVFMPRDSSYLARNLEIVGACDILVGFPEYHESHPNSVRSGTWQTIRKGKLSDRKVIVHILSDIAPE